MQPDQQFSNTLINQIAEIVGQLDHILTWIDVDEGELTTYWQQTERPEPSRFRAELNQNIDWAANRGELLGYKNFVWNKLKSVVEMKEKVEQWLEQNPNQNNSTAVLFRQYPNYPIVSKPDPKEQLRRTVSKIQSYLEVVIQTLVNVWQPLHPKSKQATETEKTPPPPAYSSFEELFINPADVGPCVFVLHSVEPPLINKAGRWIGNKGSKSGLVAWIERLEYCDKIHRIAARRDIVPLLNAYFGGPMPGYLAQKPPLMTSIRHHLML